MKLLDFVKMHVSHLQHGMRFWSYREMPSSQKDFQWHSNSLKKIKLSQWFFLRICILELRTTPNKSTGLTNIHFRHELWKSHIPDKNVAKRSDRTFSKQAQNWTYLISQSDGLRHLKWLMKWIQKNPSKSKLPATYWNCHFTPTSSRRTPGAELHR
jgi:hypothetical protein